MFRNSRPSYSFAREPSGGFSGSDFFAATETAEIEMSRKVATARLRKVFFKRASGKAGILFGAKPESF
jgi:hypothetical protein